MENASKALIIAGSILVVILLIAVGMRVFNATSGTTENTKTTMQATEIAMFNNKFIAYAGSNKSAAQVKALANVVIAHNAVNSHKVSINGSTDATTITTYVSSLSGLYTINLTHDDATGLIKTITISN